LTRDLNESDFMFPDDYPVKSSAAAIAAFKAKAGASKPRSKE
jgi:hypothetical protein